MIDLHCHLDLYESPESIVKECIQRNLYVLSMTTTPSAWEKSSLLGLGSNRIRTALGLHPELAKERRTELSLFDRYFEDCKYIGEIGLDGSDRFKSFWSEQVEVFQHILQKCNASQDTKILSIHSRNAVKEVLVIIGQYPNVGKVILHWFTGSKSELQLAIDNDCWFSINPIMTEGQKGRDLIQCMPQNRVLLESDGPFGMRNGKSLNPWEAVDSLNYLGKIWSLSPSETQRQVMSNFRELVEI